MTPSLALAHLTILGTPPPVMAALAASAGYGSIGVRLLPATKAEIRHDMSKGSYLVKETRKVLEETGLRVLDVEALSLDGFIGREDWLGALDVAQQLGARVLNVIGADWNRHRLIDKFALLASDAEDFGVRASLEPISYQAVRTIQDASSVITEVGRGGIMLDTLHFHRAGGQPDDVDDIPLDQFSVVQLSDGPAAERQSVAIPSNDPMGQKEGATTRELESRVLRDLPGDGDFPLARLLRKLGSTVPISIEVPNPALVEQIGESEYIRRAHQKTVSLLHDTFAPLSEAPSPTLEHLDDEGSRART